MKPAPAEPQVLFFATLEYESPIRSGNEWLLFFVAAVSLANCFAGTRQPSPSYTYDGDANRNYKAYNKALKGRHHWHRVQPCVQCGEVTNKALKGRHSWRTIVLFRPFRALTIIPTLITPALPAGLLMAPFQGLR